MFCIDSIMRERERERERGGGIKNWCLRFTHCYGGNVYLENTVTKYTNLNNEAKLNVRVFLVIFCYSVIQNGGEKCIFHLWMQMVLSW